MSYAATIILATLLGFLGGLLSFKVKSRWCPTCGAVKSCPTCTGWAKSAVPPEGCRTTGPDVAADRNWLAPAGLLRAGRAEP
jgi:hypothetical protein